MDYKKIVLHIITGLGDGGAEGVLARLCSHENSFKHVVISFMDGGKYGSILNESGVEVYCLNMKQGVVSIKPLFRLFKLIKKVNPDLVQTWMYHADLIGGVLARLAGVRHVFWGVRNSTLVPSVSKRSTIFISKLCAKLSHFIPSKIICCAYDALSVHKNIGYNNDKLVVIQNGYDLKKFKLDREARLRVREELKIRKGEFLIGTVGRYDPQKDHLNLLKSLKILLKKNINFKCILVGKGLTSSNTVLLEDINRLKLNNNIILGGIRSDIPAIMNALDLHILPSAYGEGFPNVVAEAMACGTPCIATDVGDAREIVLNNDFLVEVKNAHELASKIEKYYSIYKEDNNKISVLQYEAIEKVVTNYSISKMVKSFEDVWNTKL